LSNWSNQIITVAHQGTICEKLDAGDGLILFPHVAPFPPSLPHQKPNRHLFITFLTAGVPILQTGSDPGGKSYPVAH